MACRKELKILDFGLAEVEGQAVVSEAHAVRGTAQFMAPEQVLGTWSMRAPTSIRWVWSCFEC